MTHPVLTALGLTQNESGTYLGSDQWSSTQDAGVLEPVNPTDGAVLAKVHASSQSDYVHRALLGAYRPGRGNVVVLDHFGAAR